MNSCSDNFTMMLLYNNNRRWNNITKWKNKIKKIILNTINQ